MLPEAEPLLTGTEVARYLRVDPKTVSRWAKKGWISCVMTAGGHRRYPESEVLRIRNGEESPVALTEDL